MTGNPDLGLEILPLVGLVGLLELFIIQLDLAGDIVQGQGHVIELHAVRLLVGRLVGIVFRLLFLFTDLYALQRVAGGNHGVIGIPLLQGQGQQRVYLGGIDQRRSGQPGL